MVQKFSRKNRQYRAIRDKIFYGLFVFCTLIGVLGLATLLIDVFLDGYQWVNIDFITNYASRFPEQSGILSPLMGTLWVVGLTALMVIPIGLGTAIYLEEFAEDNFITKNSIETRNNCFHLYLNENYGQKEIDDIINAISKVENYFSR